MILQQSLPLDPTCKQTVSSQEARLRHALVRKHEGAYESCCSMIKVGQI